LGVREGQGGSRSTRSPVQSSIATRVRAVFVVPPPRRSQNLNQSRLKPLQTASNCVISAATSPFPLNPLQWVFGLLIGDGVAWITI
jgi:hypothetical protein